VQPFKPGAAHLAIRCRVPLVPVFVAGTREVWPIGRISPRLLAWRRLQRRRVDVHFGSPIQPGVEASAKAETELTGQLREAIIELGAKHGAR
jgi:1-acyl-sn-glycerol-3-phosphate acyltransferase